MDDGGSSNLENQYNRRLIAILTFFVLLAAIGILVALIYGFQTNSLATCIVWALACFISGAAVGFLFGIPKTLQGAKSTSDNKDNKEAPDYQLQVNTNLTEISDWLTKIIVGLGLVKLTKLPPYIRALAVSMADGIQAKDKAGPMAFAYGTISCFSILGFLFGYLFTRLVLSKAFSMADQESLQRFKGQVLIQLASLESKQGLLTHTIIQSSAANSSVAEGDLASDDEKKLAKIREMADSYMAVNIEDLAARTKAKDTLADGMGIYALEQKISTKTIYDYIQTKSSSNEGMVAALATLININPSPGDLGLLLQAGQHLTRLHVRYRVLMALVTLFRKGYITGNDKGDVVALVKAYRLKADDSLLREIDFALSLLDP